MPTRSASAERSNVGFNLPFMKWVAILSAAACILLAYALLAEVASGQEPRTDLRSAPQLEAESLPNAPDPAMQIDDDAEQQSQNSSTGKHPVAAQKGSVFGTVQDPNGLAVPGALVRLENLKDHIEQSMSSIDNGSFNFTDLPPGHYRLVITAPGMGRYESSDFEVKSADTHIISGIVLPLATQTSEVRVYANKDEIAQEEIHIEEEQRVLGVFPNFYSSFDWNAPAMNSKQKFHLVSHSILDPMSFLAVGMIAGMQQGQNTYPSYGQGMEGYAKRYGAAFATDTISVLMSRAVYPAFFHQDPRYFYKGTGSYTSRTFYAISQSVLCRGDNGRQQFNYSHLLGNVTAGAISNLYYPASDRGVSLTFLNSLIGIGASAAENLVREFVFKGITTHSTDKAPALQ